MAAADQLIADADPVTSKLGMPNVGGGVKYGYRDIVESLYKHAVEPQFSSDSAPLR